MTDTQTERPEETLQESINRRIRALLDQCVLDGMLLYYSDDGNGKWTTVARYGVIHRSEFRSDGDVVNYLDGISTAKAFFDASSEIDDIRSRLGTLVCRGILSVVGGNPPADEWFIAGKGIQTTHLASRDEALEFLSRYEQ